MNKTFLPLNGDEQGSLSDIASKVIDYVTENLADPYLSLKKISERVLFMNPDYVSKTFYQRNPVRNFHSFSHERAWNMRRNFWPGSTN